MYIKPKYAMLGRESLKLPYVTKCEQEYCPESGYQTCAFFYF